MSPELTRLLVVLAAVIVVVVAGVYWWMQRDPETERDLSEPLPLFSSGAGLTSPEDGAETSPAGRPAAVAAPFSPPVVVPVPPSATAGPSSPREVASVIPPATSPVVPAAFPVAPPAVSVVPAVAPPAPAVAPPAAPAAAPAPTLPEARPGDRTPAIREFTTTSPTVPHGRPAIASEAPPPPELPPTASPPTGPAASPLTPAVTPAVTSPPAPPAAIPTIRPTTPGVSSAASVGSFPPNAAVVSAHGVPGTMIEGHGVRFSVPAEGTLQFLPGRFEIRSGLDTGKEIRFVHVPGPDGMVVTFGRADGELYRHIQLRDKTVSRRHARMQFRDGRWHLVNLSGTNPVTYNGVELAADREQVLADGDRIDMGEVAFTFRSR